MVFYIKSVLEFGCWLAFPQVCMCWDQPFLKYWSICLPLKHGSGRGNLAFVCRVLWEGQAMSWLWSGYVLAVREHSPFGEQDTCVPTSEKGAKWSSMVKSVLSGEAEITWALGFLSTWLHGSRQSHIACTVTDGGEPALTHPPSCLPLWYTEWHLEDYRQEKAHI